MRVIVRDNEEETIHVIDQIKRGKCIPLRSDQRLGVG